MADTSTAKEPDAKDFVKGNDYQTMRGGIFGFAILAMFALGLGLLVVGFAFLAHEPFRQGLTTFAGEHFRAVICVPVAAFASFLIVWAFSVAEGPIKVSVTKTFAFEGAASHLTFWVIVFIAIVAAINLSWP